MEEEEKKKRRKLWQMSKLFATPPLTTTTTTTHDYFVDDDNPGNFVYSCLHLIGLHAAPLALLFLHFFFFCCATKYAIDSVYHFCWRAACNLLHVCASGREIVSMSRWTVLQKTSSCKKQKKTTQFCLMFHFLIASNKKMYIFFWAFCLRLFHVQQFVCFDLLFTFFLQIFLITQFGNFSLVVYACQFAVAL